jgi:hypothetical protein
MKQYRMTVCTLLLSLTFAVVCSGQEMTPERFRELVDRPGDNVPLSPIITNGAPRWSVSMTTFALKYPSGQVLSEDLLTTTKTIGGKYIVYDSYSKIQNRELRSVLECDEKAGTLKIYSLYGDALIHSDVTYDARAKTYTVKLAYGDGFTEEATGWYSDKIDCSHTVVKQRGVLIMNRDATNRPVSISK